MKALKLTKPPAPLEREEQAAYFGWLRYQRHNGLRLFDFAFAVPNGSYLYGEASRRAIQGMALQRQGVSAGVPDAFLLLPIAPFHGLAIEFKRVGGAAPTEEQAAWHARLRSQGYFVYVAYGFEQARLMTLDYLQGGTHANQ